MTGVIFRHFPSLLVTRGLNVPEDATKSYSVRLYPKDVKAIEAEAKRIGLDVKWQSVLRRIVHEGVLKLGKGVAR